MFKHLRWLAAAPAALMALGSAHASTMIAIWDGTFTGSVDGVQPNVDPSLLYHSGPLSGSFEITIEYDPDLNFQSGYGIHGPIQSFVFHSSPGLPLPVDLGNTYFGQSSGSIVMTSNTFIYGSEVFSLTGNSSDIPADPAQPFSTNLDSGRGGIVHWYGQVIVGNFSLTPTSLTVEDYLGEFVPEPATWTMMLSGFGGIGWMMRMARRRAAAAISL